MTWCTTASMVLPMSSFRNPAGVDLDLIFASRVSAKAANVNFRNTDSVDISNRYEKANAVAPAATTNLRGPDGRDLNLWFTTSATTALSVNVSSNDASYDNGLSSSPTTRLLSAGASAVASGGTGSYTYTWSIVNSSSTVSNSLSTTSGNNTTINATVQINVPGTVTVKCVVSDGMSTAEQTRTSTFNYYNAV